MSNRNAPSSPDQWRWAIGGAVVMVLGLFACIVVLFTQGDPDRDPMPLVLALIGLASTVVLALLALLKVGETSRTAAETTKATASAVSELANGSMDAKIRLAVAEVLAPHLVDPGAIDGLATDRLRVRELDRVADDLRRRAAE